MKKAMAVLILAFLLPVPLFACECEEPTYEEVIIDGDVSEWDPSNDMCIDLILAGGGGHHQEVMGTACLRYDCEKNELYVMVSPAEGNQLIVNGSEEHWVSVDHIKKVDDTSPNFAWSPSIESPTAWEAGFSQETGDFFIDIHTLISDGEETQTAAIYDLRLKIDCGSTSIVLSNFTAFSATPATNLTNLLLAAGIVLVALITIGFVLLIIGSRS